MNLIKIIKRIKRVTRVSTDGGVASLLNMKRSTLAERKSKNSVPYPQIISFAEQKSISINWLLTGQGRKYVIKEEFQEEVKVGDELDIKITGPDGRIIEHAIVDAHGRPVSQPGGDPLIQAMAAVKEILDSENPILIQALNLNLSAFQLAARRDKQLTGQAKKIDKLEEECDELKERIAALEEKGVIPGPGAATASKAI